MFLRPDGTLLKERIRVEKCFRGNISELNRANGIQIDAQTVDSRWAGERMDYGMVIDALVAARERREPAVVSEP